MYCFPEISVLSRSELCDASGLLAPISSSRENFVSGILSFFTSVGNLCLTLFAALSNRYKAGGVISMPRKLFIAFTPPKIYFSVFCARISPVCFVKETYF